MSIKIIIERTDEGQVTINGPINDKILCYGLLETAKDAVREYNDSQRKSIITPVIQLPGNGIPNAK